MAFFLYGLAMEGYGYDRLAFHSIYTGHYRDMSILGSMYKAMVFS